MFLKPGGQLFPLHFLLRSLSVADGLEPESVVRLSSHKRVRRLAAFYHHAPFQAALLTG
jgi:hypothetical protein